MKASQDAQLLVLLVSQGPVVQKRDIKISIVKYGKYINVLLKKCE